MTGKTRIIVHDDLDGAAAGAVAVLMTDPPKEVVHCSYDTIDWHVTEVVYKSSAEDLIIIADICPGPDAMKRLNALPAKTILVDHHETRRDLVDMYDWAVYSSPDCGALGLYKELTRQGYVLFGADDKQKSDLEHFLSAVDAYDTWDLDSPDRTRGEWLNRLCGFFRARRFRRIIEQSFGSIEHLRMSLFELDDVILGNQTDYAAKAVDRVQIKRDGEGYRVGLVHAEQHRSEVGHAILGARSLEVDYVVVVDWMSDALSLRSSKVDVGKIAARWGGGGHGGAAGIPTVHQGYLDSLEDL